MKLKRKDKLRIARPVQAKALWWGNGKDCVAFYLEQRLGKCLVALRWAIGRGFKRILIVAPKTTLGAWVEECRLEGLAAVKLTGAPSLRLKKALSCTVGVITPGGLVALPELADGWDCCILDESVVIKNPRAQVTKALIGMRHQFKGRAVLSGLPAPESPTELCCQFLFLTGSFMGFRNYWHFEKAAMFKLPFGKAILKAGYWHTIQNWLQMNAFLARRLKQAKSFRIVKLKANTAQLELIQKVRDEWSWQSSQPCPNDSCDKGKQWEPDEEGSPRAFKCWGCEGTGNAVIETKYAVTVQQWLCRIAGGFNPEGSELVNRVKLRKVATLAGQFNQLVVWCNFTAEIEAVAKTLADRGFNVETLQGCHSATKRTQTLKRFKQGKLDVVVAQVACAQYGCTMNTSDAAVYYSTPFSCNLWKQSQDRIVSTQQKGKKPVILLCTKGTIDKHCIQSARGKGLSAVALVADYMRGFDQ